MIHFTHQWNRYSELWLKYLVIHFQTSVLCMFLTTLMCGSCENRLLRHETVGL